MLRTRSLALRRSGRLLFQDVDLTIHQGRKVGIVGRNACGKSTLFSALLGQLDADTGSIDIPEDWRIAHMAQETPALDISALDHVLAGDETLADTLEALAAAERNDDATALAQLHDVMDRIDGYTARHRAARLLQGLGFADEALESPVAEFSGGWRMRINLARALMCPADLLLLDEPTNHLDLDTVIWLEGQLRRFPGTLLLISHDREFLDATCDHIVHAHDGNLKLYAGGFSQFERQRAEALARQQGQYEKQQAEIQRIESFIRRFKAKASKAVQAQSRVKALARMQRIAPAHVDSPFRFEIPAAPRQSDPLLRLEEVVIGYGRTAVAHCPFLHISPGDRIGLLGVNGAGKSTLIRTIAGELPLLSGRRECGQHLAIGYFSQHQVDHLEPRHSPLQLLRAIDPQTPELALRNFLGGFDFTGERCLKPVGDCSGGEKARVALAVLAWQKPNLLLLDEPTNHLDMEMRDALTLALQSFEGAMLVVSHDRHLLDNAVDQFLYIRDGQVELFNGDLAAYQTALRSEHQAAAVTDTAANPAGSPPAATMSGKQVRNRNKTLQGLRTRLNTVERKLEQTQHALAEVESRLADSSLYSGESGGQAEELARLQASRGNLAAQAETLETDWLTLQESIDTLTDAARPA